MASRVLGRKSAGTFDTEGFFIQGCFFTSACWVPCSPDSLNPSDCSFVASLSLSLSDLQTWSPGWHFLILSADKNRSDGKLSSAQEHVQEMSCCRPLRVCILHRGGTRKCRWFVILDSDLFRSVKSDISHLGSIAIRSFMPLLRWFPCIYYQLFLIVWFIRAGSDFPFTCVYGLRFVEQLTIRRSRWIKRLYDVWWISCCWYQRSCCSCAGGRDSSLRLWTPPSPVFSFFLQETSPFSRSCFSEWSLLPCWCSLPAAQSCLKHPAT